MKLRKLSSDKLALELDGREKAIFCELLRLYPRVPPSFVPISKTGHLPDRAGSQKLIDEAL
ncbi:MAG TPA: hypothetical protein VHI52_08490, partial [Verrucomicrobiae bacterium]|nr:hypothetical protein [Verrucomicrobiae bacterium]